MLTVVGMGPAGLHLMTPAARAAVEEADVLVGGKRHLQQFPDFRGEQFALGANIPELLAWIAAHWRSAGTHHSRHQRGAVSVRAVGNRHE